MNELLNRQNVEVTASEWFTDEERGCVVSVQREVAQGVYNEFMEIHSFIQTVQTDIKWKCLFIGWALKDILDRKLYLYLRKNDSYSLQGYSSFYKFVRDVYGFKERTAKRMVAVAREFCQATEIRDCDDPREQKPICALKLAYANYSYSQLAEMLSVEEKYRRRISIKASVREIRSLGKLYATGYVPKASETYEDDLVRYTALKKEQQKKENAAKNRIEFVSAQSTTATVPTSAPSKDATIEGEDARDVITPPMEEKTIPFSAIRSGLSAQLTLMRKNCPEWERFAETVLLALQMDNPALIDAQGNLKSSKGEKAPTGKLDLKNLAERKDWIKDYKAWGVWIDVPEVSKRYYRYDFINGASIIVEEYVYWYAYGTGKEAIDVRFAIVDKEHDKFIEGLLGGVWGAADWMTKHAKEI